MAHYTTVFGNLSSITKYGLHCTLWFHFLPHNPSLLLVSRCGEMLCSRSEQLWDAELRGQFARPRESAWCLPGFRGIRTPGLSTRDLRHVWMRRGRSLSRYGYRILRNEKNPISSCYFASIALKTSDFPFDSLSSAITKREGGALITQNTCWGFEGGWILKKIRDYFVRFRLFFVMFSFLFVVLFWIILKYWAKSDL